MLDPHVVTEAREKVSLGWWWEAWRGVVEGGWRARRDAGGGGCEVEAWCGGWWVSGGVVGGEGEGVCEE